MITLKQHFINYVVAETAKRFSADTPFRVMDIGCGTAAYVPALVKQFPNMHYVGIEPIQSSFAHAEKNLAGIEQAKVHFQLGYGELEGEELASFDLVFSLSVLEHIKQLEKFIAFGAQYAKSGATVMHRYDLGHALYSHSHKERLHVFLGNNFPWILPERQFVRYLSSAEVEQCYKNTAIDPVSVTYHQMPNHKGLEKVVTNDETIADLFAWETKHQAEFLKIPLEKREKLFPAVAVWGTKQ